MVSMFDLLSQGLTGAAVNQYGGWWSFTTGKVLDRSPRKLRNGALIGRSSHLLVKLQLKFHWSARS